VTQMRLDDQVASTPATHPLAVSLRESSATDHFSAWKLSTYLTAGSGLLTPSCCGLDPVP
jgi:hypothetical protein